MRYRVLTILLISMLLFGLNSNVAQAATTTVACSISGTFTIADNVVTENNACTGTAIIPASVTSIGNNAFADASALTAITIPAGVTSIGFGAFATVFSGSSALSSVTFASGSQLTFIGDNAFADASALTAITIPAGVTSLGYGTFAGSAITSVTFAAGSQLTSIGTMAFASTRNLTAITIPAGVTSIGGGAFMLSTLTSVTFAAGSQLTTIEESAFYDAYNLTVITIPAGVTTIGNSAFEKATALKSVYFLGNKPTLGTDVFKEVTDATAYISPTATGYPAVGSLMEGLTIAVGTV